MAELSKNCPQCGAPRDLNLGTCKYCGEIFPAEQPRIQPQAGQQMYQQPIQQPIQQPMYQQQMYQQPMYQQPMPVNYTQELLRSGKSKTTAGILGIILGGLGIHKFYLGKWTGVIYLLFCWTYIPSIIGFIEGIMYLTSSDEKFYLKYVQK